MAVSYGFFDGDAYYGQEEFNRYFNYLYESGVGMNDDGEMTLAVTAGSGAVNVAAGFALIRGFYLYNSESLSLEVSTPTTYSRMDRVVVRGSLVSGPLEIVLKAGEPASVPLAPTLTRNSSVWEISLAKVLITTAGAITVTDERSRSAVCGAIRPRNIPEIANMIDNAQAEWDAWFAEQQSNTYRPIHIGTSAPDNPANGYIWLDTSTS